jgi:4-hydroxybenzoate polyprenyltransferase
VSAAPAEKGTRASELVFLLQVSRPGLWSTTALFYLMPLGHADFLHSRTLWLGLFYVLFPLGFLLYGVNDIVDAEADRLNPRKGTFLFGSLGAAEQLAALRWEIAAVQIPFLIIFFFLVGPRILAWFGALLIAVGIYNAPRFGWKSHPPFDVLIQASYLLVFVLSSWLNGVAQLPWQTFLFGAMFAMHSHIFGEVMDIEPDRLSGRRTTATLIGAVPSKLLIAGILCVETVLVYFFFGDLVITGFLGFGAAWFVLDALAIWKNRPYSPTEMRLFMWGWNATALLGIYWNWAHSSLTPVRHVAGL